MSSPQQPNQQLPASTPPNWNMQPAPVQGGPYGPANYGAPTGPAPQKQAITLQFLLNVWRQWWLIALPIGLLLAATACITTFVLFTPKFRATAVMQINLHDYLAFPTKVDPKQFVLNQIQLIKSELVLGEVISNPDIARIPRNRQVVRPHAVSGQDTEGGESRQVRLLRH